MKDPKFEVCPDCGSDWFDTSGDSLNVRKCRDPECQGMWLTPRKLVEREERRIRTLETDCNVAVNALVDYSQSLTHGKNARRVLEVLGADYPKKWWMKWIK